MRRSQRESGIALVTALSFVVVIALLTGTMLFLSRINVQQASDLRRTTQAQYAAESGIEQVVKDYYYAPLAAIANSDQRTLEAYRKTLKDNKALDNNASAILAVGNVVYDGFNGTYTASVRRVDDDKAATPGILQTAKNATTKLLVTSTGKLPDGTTRVLTQTLYVSNTIFTGFDFALLSNNVNCIFCHAKVTSMDDAYKTRGNNERFDRVKVATLQTLEARSTSADTFIGGTLYTRGGFKCDSQGGTAYCDGTGNVIQPQNTDIATYDLDASAQVGTTKTRLNATGTDCSDPQNGGCQKNQNFYRNYPSGAGPDGSLPADFPPPIPDANSNRKIDDSEWQKAVAEDNSGTLSGPGQLFKPNQQFNANLLDKTQVIAKSADSSDGVAGNLVLKSTASNPINISGTLYVNGDVIISGRVAGNGKIVARGNIYVVGDVEYDCSATQNSDDCDYSKRDKLPQFGMVAGGNIMVGDYMTPKTTFVGAPMPGIAKGQTALTDPNYLEPNVVYNNGKYDITYADGQSVGQDVDPSFVAGEVSVFNAGEIAKAQKDSTYVPRLYTMRDADVVFYYDGNSEKPDRYSQLKPVPQSILGRAAIVSLSPELRSSNKKEPWIQENDLKQLWINNIETGPRKKISELGNQPLNPKDKTKNKPLQIDGLMYSNNAVFALARGASKVQGSTIINGSLVGADLGLLSSGSDASNGSRMGAVDGGGSINPGFQLNYDDRLASLFPLKGNLGLSRSDFQFGKAP